jgi:3-dehydro-4-phosphotetronate decarboxylase
MTANHESAARAVCRAGRLLAKRGLTPGTSGNISVRVDGGFLMTPTNAALAELRPDRLAILNERGDRVGGEAETKERNLHLAVYENRPDAKAIVHVHSTYAVALSCLAHPDAENVLLPLTPYAIMRVGRLPLVPYAKPGSTELAAFVRARAADSHAVLLANHGPIFAGATLASAVSGIEEVEEAAKLQLLLHARDVRALADSELEALRS